MTTAPGAPPPEEEPNSKRQKTDEINLIPEDQFLLQHSGPIEIIVQVPTDTEKNEWNFNGQNVTLILNPKDTIQTLKDKIKESLGMPQNKQKLKAPGISILKETYSLAYYNMRSGTTVSLGVKERGGRKK